MAYLKSGLVFCACMGASLASHEIGYAAAASASGAVSTGTPFSRDWLLSEALRVARQPYVEPKQDRHLGALGNIGYEKYRSIRFQKGASIWQREGRGFTVDLFHPGFIYKTPIELDLVVGGRARGVRFTPNIFDYGSGVKRPDDGAALNYSGFGSRYPINRADVLDEFLAFQGASYFRAVGRGQRYGLSARGLAVKTGDNEGEEFPAFTRFWIERPPVGATKLVIHALLDSPSVTGAYTFTVQPGDGTRMDVQLTLFPRVDMNSVGIAPLTSMFLFDTSNHTRFDDFRNAVHDSDGLQVITGSGERLWRPLANPTDLQISFFLDSDPRGFGLVQRQRSYLGYEDSEARYELHPSAWVEPLESWGRGSVELVEIPSSKEMHDNIVAFWRPAKPLQAGQRYDFSYRLYWVPTPADEQRLARVVATRMGATLNEKRRLIVVDFDAAGSRPRDVRALVSASTGTITGLRGPSITPARLYRVSFELDPDNADVVELRLGLMAGDKPWSETWLYRWTP